MQDGAPWASVGVRLEDVQIIHCRMRKQPFGLKQHGVSRRTFGEVLGLMCVMTVSLVQLDFEMSRKAAQSFDAMTKSQKRPL